MGAASDAKIIVREATPADLKDVTALLSARDGIDRSQQVVDAYLWGLDPSCTRTWLAYVGNEPVGITMLYLRHMRWPQEDNSSTMKLAGYWSHLYVMPEYRKLMIYPQLVLGMIRGMRTAEIDLIFTATRQADVAEGHQKLGFALVSKMPLRLRPLRPFRLLAKHKGAGLLAPFCGPSDAIYQFLLGREPAQDVPIEEISLESSDVEEIVALLNSPDNDLVRQDWTVEQFRRRFRTTLDGTKYRLTAIRSEGRLVAGLITALVERGNNIRAGIVLDIAALPSASLEQVNSLIAEAEQHAHRHEAEVMLALERSLFIDQWGDTYGKYLANDSETYHMLVYPKPLAQEPFAAAQLENWYFSYADHDAF